VQLNIYGNNSDVNVGVNYYEDVTDRLTNSVLSGSYTSFLRKSANISGCVALVDAALMDIPTISDLAINTILMPVSESMPTAYPTTISPTQMPSVFALPKTSTFSFPLFYLLLSAVICAIAYYAYINFCSSAKPNSVISSDIELGNVTPKDKEDSTPYMPLSPSTRSSSRSRGRRPPQKSVKSTANTALLSSGSSVDSNAVKDQDEDSLESTSLLNDRKVEVASQESSKRQTYRSKITPQNEPPKVSTEVTPVLTPNRKFYRGNSKMKSSDEKSYGSLK
jgi:hypothetical protein